MKTFCLLAAALTVATFTQAQDWTGAVNSDWNNPANWDGTPQNGDDITVSFANYSGAMAHPVITANSNFSPAQMLVDGGAILTINANLTTTDRVEILGAGTQVVLNAGILNISGGAGNARFIFADESHFEMNGGELNVGQRLLFELGASGEMNDGTIDIAETFALIDGTGAVSSSFVQNGGFIATDEFGFENEAGDFHPMYTMTDGILNINAAFLTEGAAPGAGIGEFYATGGTASVAGTFGNLAGSTMNYVFRIEEEAVLNLTVSAIDQLVGDSIVVSNGGTMNVNANLTWNNAGTLYGEGGEVVINGNTVMNGSGEYQFPKLTVLPNKTLSQIEPLFIAVNGDFALGGNYNHLSHGIEFNGNLVQSFTFTQPQTLHEVILNNSAGGLTVNGNITISDFMSWEDGILHLGSNTLTFQDATLSNNASEESYAIGKVTKQGQQAFEFPVGADNNRYRPVAISAPTDLATAITVEYRPEAYASLTPVDEPLQSVSSLEYWSITRSGSTGFVTASVSWNDATASGLVDCASISLAHWDNASWSMVASTATGLCTGNGAGTLASSADLEAFGIYTIGFTEGVYQQAVTVCHGESFTVGANTYTESGVYYDTFTDVNGEDSIVVTGLTVLAPVDVSVAHTQFFLIAAQSGATYQWIDCANGMAPIIGETEQDFIFTENGNYAVIIDLNGCVDTSDCVAITGLGIDDEEMTLTLAPNPVRADGKVTIASQKTVQEINVFTADGKKVETAFVVAPNSTVMDAPKNPGIYFVFIVFEDGSGLGQKIQVFND